MIQFIHKGSLLLSCLLASSLTTTAELWLPRIFADHMVLQQSSNVKFWGTAKPGEIVSVAGSWTDAGSRVEVDENGNWQLSIETPSATSDSIAYRVTVTGEEESITYRDVLIGEVWLLSGQSNMKCPIDDEMVSSVMSTVSHPKMRLMVVGNNSAAYPQKRIPSILWKELDDWSVCNPQNMEGFSAVGYYFGKNLIEHVNVPIGLIQCARGSSTCEAWTSAEDLERIHDYHGKGPWVPQGVDDRQTPSILWNGMLKPIVPFTIRGVLWYQGESNIGRAENLSQLFPQMIEGWRREWGQGDFPFYFVQISPWANYDDGDEPLLWEAQASSLFLKNTEMVTTIDLVDEDDRLNIHPNNKEAIGERLANLARAKLYGETNLIYQGPIYSSMSVVDDSIIVEFQHADSGLKSKNETLDWFEIAGEDDVYYPAIATIEGHTVRLSSDEVDSPLKARYAWSRFASGDLFNDEGLPAPPFRTNPATYLTSNLGRVERPMESRSTGFFEKNGRIFNTLGDEFKVYGVNSLHNLYDAKDQFTAFESLDHIRETSLSNLVRVVWSAQGRGSLLASAEHLDQIIERCLALKMVPLLSFENVANNGESQHLVEFAEVWTSSEYLEVIRKYEKEILIDVAGNCGSSEVDLWKDAYKDAISVMRTNHGGTNVALVIGASLDGRDPYSILKFGRELIDFDLQHNLIFSIHIDGSFSPESSWTKVFNQMRAKRLPVLVGGLQNYSTKAPSETTTEIMKSCVDSGIGYIAWVWSGDLKDSETNIVSELDWMTPTEWGKEILNDRCGLIEQAKVSTHFE